MKKLLLICCLWVVSASAAAQAYKCTEPNGQIQYTQQPCQNGKQQAVDLDARNAEKQKGKALERARLEAEQKRLEPILKEQRAQRAAEYIKETKPIRDKFLLIDYEKVKEVVDCQKSGCSSYEYRDLLIGRPPGMIEDVLNCRTQEVSSARRRYCSVLLIDAGRVRNARLQIMTGYVPNLPDGVVNGDRINEVNVY